MKLWLCLAVAHHVAIAAAFETLLVHGGGGLSMRIERACRLASGVNHLALAGSEVDMYAMRAEVRRQCPTVLPQTKLLHVYANTTADCLVCTLQRLPGTTVLTQLVAESHTESVQLLSSWVAPLVPHVRWFYVGLPDPPHASRLGREQPGWRAETDMLAALTGPCAPEAFGTT